MSHCHWQQNLKPSTSQHPTLLLGLGGPLRTLRAGPGGMLFGTLDASLAFEQPAAHGGIFNQQQEHGSLGDPESGGGVIDLCGKLDKSGTSGMPSLFNIRAEGLQERLAVASTPHEAVAAQTAKVRVTMPKFPNFVCSTTKEKLFQKLRVPWWCSWCKGNDREVDCIICCAVISLHALAFCV